MNERLLKILGGEEKYYPHSLESNFPRIFEKVMLLWDSPEMSDYFAELMVPARQNRAGFPSDVAAEIMRLSLVHFSTHAPDKQQDVWEVSTDKFASFKPSVDMDVVGAWKPLPVASARALEGLGVPCSAKGFHRAAATGNRRAVALFLEAGVNTELANERGWTPIMLAVFNGHDEIVNLLIKYKANVHARDLHENTPLHWCADAGQMTSAKSLVENSAEIDARNKSGLTPLFMAVSSRHLGVVLLLLDSGANFDAVTGDGSTALHKAASMGYTEIVRALLFQGADASIKDGAGYTAYSLAEKNNQQAVMSILMANAKKTAI